MLAALLKEKGQTVAVADSFAGGLKRPDRQIAGRIWKHLRRPRWICLQNVWGRRFSAEALTA